MNKLASLAFAGLLLLGACSSGDDSMKNMDHNKAKPKKAACAPSGSELSISARNLKFDKDCLAAPADTDFTIALENNDTDQHNVVIVKEHMDDKTLFKGELFGGPNKTKTYEVDAFKAGSYHFHCELHPNMMGDFEVR